LKINPTLKLNLISLFSLFIALSSLSCLNHHHLDKYEQQLGAWYKRKEHIPHFLDVVGYPIKGNQFGKKTTAGFLAEQSTNQRFHFLLSSSENL
jgi:hypothetical protein